MAERGRQKQGEKDPCLLLQNVHHPSLRVKKVQGTNYIFEARASDAIRLTFHLEGDFLALRVIGRHDEVLRKP